MTAPPNDDPAPSQPLSRVPAHQGPDRMQIPEYVKRELSEVYLLMDHIAGCKDRKLDEALAPPTTGGQAITLEDICGVAWPPSEHNRARTLGLVLTAKDRLSHAAFPATGHSVAFTYLATNSPAVPSVFNHFRPNLVRGPSNFGRVKEGDWANAGGRGAMDSVALHTSTMAQFARDAFPGLEGKRHWLGEATNFLSIALLFLLVVTCVVGWDLAVGQRLLADYRWLSQHPQTMQDDKASDAVCSKEHTVVGPSPATNLVPASGGEATQPGEIMPGGQCARLRAFERVQPSMVRWIYWQIPLRWFIEGTPPVADEGLSQGYVLELTRVLVTTLNYNVLPLFLGALAATAAAWRAIARKIEGNELEPRDLMQIWQRVLLGAFLGGVIGLLIAPGASNGLFALVGSQGATVSSETTSDTVALSPAIYAFLAGFATGRIFQWLDHLVERIFANSNPKP
jgi:hypothetical protein